MSTFCSSHAENSQLCPGLKVHEAAQVVTRGGRELPLWAAIGVARPTAALPPNRQAGRAALLLAPPVGAGELEEGASRPRSLKESWERSWRMR